MTKYIVVLILAASKLTYWLHYFDAYKRNLKKCILLVLVSLVVLIEGETFDKSSCNLPKDTGPCRGSLNIFIQLLG